MYHGVSERVTPVVEELSIKYLMLFHHDTLTIIKSIEQNFLRIFLHFFRSVLVRNLAISSSVSRVKAFVISMRSSMPNS